LAGGLLATPVIAQEVRIPPDTVTTVLSSDTVRDFGSVGGVVTDALGYVYFADFQNSVWRLRPDGGVDRFADGLYGGSGNGIGPRGELYQSNFNGNYVSRISRDGRTETWVDEGLSGPVGIAVNPEGELFVCNCSAGTISRVGADRAVTVFAASELLSCPNGITFDDRGDLYVVNFNNAHVVRITPDGEASSFTQIPGAGGNGHITFARGGFYVTQFRGERVFRVARDDSFTVVARTGIRGEDDGDALGATFSSPNGIAAFPGGNVLWVNDLVRRPGGGQAGDVRLRRIRLVGLADMLAGADPAAGAARVRDIYRAYREAKPGEDTTGDAITLGFQWLSTGRVAEGVALFELNAQAHPDHVASQYNLGEAYRYTGRPDEAERQYLRTLELAPEHAQARARLDLIRGG
jgi:sugar lactone lactonase YvrE